MVSDLASGGQVSSPKLLIKLWAQLKGESHQQRVVFLILDYARVAVDKVLWVRTPAEFPKPVAQIAVASNRLALNLSLEIASGTPPVRGKLVSLAPLDDGRHNLSTFAHVLPEVVSTGLFDSLDIYYWRSGQGAPCDLCEGGRPHLDIPARAYRPLPTYRGFSVDEVVRMKGHPPGLQVTLGLDFSDLHKGRL